MKLHGHVYFQSNCYLDLYIVHSQSYALKYLLFLHHSGFLRVLRFPPPIKLKATI